MAAELIHEPRLAGLILKEAWRRARRGLRAPMPLPGLPMGLSRSGDRLVAVLRDLERGRPETAEALYCGQFDLAGTRIELSGASPFERSDAPAAWQEALYSFEWLRHLSEVEDALACEQARALVGDFLALRAHRRNPHARKPEIAARRLMAFASHSPMILAQGDEAFRRGFLQAIAREARWLRRVAPEVADGWPRLCVRMALCAASLCLQSQAGHLRAAGAQLSAELDRQIFADGGHLSRNPQVMAELLARLLPLRALFAARSLPAPRALIGAVDRMLASLRFFLHADGALALFNGAGTLSPALVATLVRHDETLGEPMGHLRQSGYQRLARGEAVVIADTGRAPPLPVSGTAHAGTLAFEFSSGRQRFVVNCGVPAGGPDALRRLARTTAAHSTLTYGDRSSSRFARSRAVDRFLGGPLVPGPTRVPATREDDETAQRLFAAHDGYRGAFGLVHEREIHLSACGTTLEGTDRLHRAANAPASAPEPCDAAIRFHLHPDVVAEQAGRGIRLAGGGEIWWFLADQPVVLEESILFAGAAGPRRTLQIVVRMEAGTPEANWRFERQR